MDAREGYAAAQEAARAYLRDICHRESEQHYVLGSRIDLGWVVEGRRPKPLIVNGGVIYMAEVTTWSLVLFVPKGPEPDMIEAFYSHAAYQDGTPLHEYRSAVSPFHPWDRHEVTCESLASALITELRSLIALADTPAPPKPKPNKEDT